MVPPRLTLVSDNTRDKDEMSTSGDETAAGHSAGRPSALRDPEAAIDHLAERAHREKLRRLEAMLFASSHALDAAALQACVEPGEDVTALLGELQKAYADRGVNVVKVAGKWMFRTADDLSFLLERETAEERKLSKAALETLAIIAYHQPVTRAEIENIRGVATSKGTLDVLMECGWIKPGRRREAPGRPLTWVTTTGFLDQFGLEALTDLPGLDEMKVAGLLDRRPAIEAIPGTGELFGEEEIASSDEQAYEESSEDSEDEAARA